MGVRASAEWYGLDGNQATWSKIGPAYLDSVLKGMLPFRLGQMCELVLQSPALLDHVGIAIRASGRLWLAGEFRIKASPSVACRVLFYDTEFEHDNIAVQAAASIKMVSHKMRDLETHVMSGLVGSISWYGAVEGEFWKGAISGISGYGDHNVASLCIDELDAHMRSRLQLARIIGNERPEGDPNRGIVSMIDM